MRLLLTPSLGLVCAGEVRDHDFAKGAGNTPHCNPGSAPSSCPAPTKRFINSAPHDGIDLVGVPYPRTAGQPFAVEQGGNSRRAKCRLAGALAT